jgi:hypothetical protein
MRTIVAGGLIALMCACIPISSLASNDSGGDADKAGKIDSYAREQLGIGIHELAWLMDASCEGSVYSTRGMEFIARKPALDRLAEKGFINLVEYGSAEFVAICPTPKGAAVRERLLRASR